MEINERIFYLLESKGLNAKDLGDYIGVKSSSISAWKHEGSYPSSKLIVRISEFLGVSIDYLFTGKESTLKESNQFINKYNQLPIEEQEEINAIIDYKYNRAFPKTTPTISSTCLSGKKATINNRKTV